jgi:hypothetical protein
LLIAIPEDSREALEQRMHDFGLAAFARPIGRMCALQEKVIRLND